MDCIFAVNFVFDDPFEMRPFAAMFWKIPRRFSCRSRILPYIEISSRKHFEQRWSPGFSLSKVNRFNEWFTNGEKEDSFFCGYRWIDGVDANDGEILISYNDFFCVIFTVEKPELTFVGFDNLVSTKKNFVASPMSVLVKKSEIFSYDADFFDRPHSCHNSFEINVQHFNQLIPVVKNALILGDRLFCQINPSANDDLSFARIFQVEPGVFISASGHPSGFRFCGEKFVSSISGISIPEGNFKFSVNVDFSGNFYLREFSLSDPNKAAKYADFFSLFSKGTEFSFGSANHTHFVFAPADRIKKSYLRSVENIYFIGSCVSEILFHVPYDAIDVSSNFFLSDRSCVAVIKEEQIDLFLPKSKARKSKHDITGIMPYNLVVQRAGGNLSATKEVYFLKEAVENAPLKPSHAIDKDNFTKLKSVYPWITAKMALTYTEDELEKEEAFRNTSNDWFFVLEADDDLIMNLIKESNHPEFVLRSIDGSIKLRKAPLAEIKEKIPDVYNKYLRSLMQDPYLREVLLDADTPLNSASQMFLH